MPLYEYRCPSGHLTEELHLDARKAPRRSSCPVCGTISRRVASTPTFRLSWALKAPDTAKEIWEGTALEGTDGINEVHYRSKKIQVDLGVRKTGVAATK